MPRRKIPENYEKMKRGMIQATIEVMTRKSMAEFSLNDIAEEVGLTKAAIYWYFSNKDALIEETAQCVYDTYIGFIDHVNDSDLSPYEKLKKIICGESDTIKAARMCVFPIKFYLESYGKNDKVKVLIEKGYEKYNQLIADLILEGSRAGEFQTDLSASELSKFITGAIDGLAFQNLLVSSDQVEVQRKIIFSVIDSILRPRKGKEE